MGSDRYSTWCKMTWKNKKNKHWTWTEETDENDVRIRMKGASGLWSVRPTITSQSLHAPPDSETSLEVVFSVDEAADWNRSNSNKPPTSETCPETAIGAASNLMQIPLHSNILVQMLRAQASTLYCLAVWSGSILRSWCSWFTQVVDLSLFGKMQSQQQEQVSFTSFYCKFLFTRFTFISYEESSIFSMATLHRFRSRTETRWGCATCQHSSHWGAVANLPIS